MFLEGIGKVRICKGVGRWMEYGSECMKWKPQKKKTVRANKKSSPNPLKQKEKKGVLEGGDDGDRVLIYEVLRIKLLSREIEAYYT